MNSLWVIFAPAGSTVTFDAPVNARTVTASGVSMMFFAADEAIRRLIREVSTPPPQKKKGHTMNCRLIYFPAAVAIAAAYALAGCATPKLTASGVMASYTLIDEGIIAWVAATNPNATTLQKAKDCENVAWAGVKPVTDAFVAGLPALQTVLSNAAATVRAAQGCLAAMGVR